MKKRIFFLVVILAVAYSGVLFNLTTTIKAGFEGNKIDQRILYYKYPVTAYDRPFEWSTAPSHHAPYKSVVIGRGVAYENDTQYAIRVLDSGTKQNKYISYYFNLESGIITVKDFSSAAKTTLLPEQKAKYVRTVEAMIKEIEIIRDGNSTLPNNYPPVPELAETIDYLNRVICECKNQI